MLRDEIALLDALLEVLTDPSTATAEIASAIAGLEQRGEQRGRLLRSLREEVTEERMREEERSVRQYVLRALSEVGVPQNAGFIQEYVWARETVDLNTRGFGALRRDERRSWSRSGGARVAYIVPALDAAGHAMSRWLARSDWPLETRIVTVPDGERLLDVHKVRALLDARGSREPQALGDPLAPLIERYAREVLDIAPPSGDRTAGWSDWAADVARQVDARLAQLSDVVAEAQRVATASVTALPRESQLWGARRSQ